LANVDDKERFLMKLTHELILELPLVAEVFLWAATIALAMFSLVVFTNYVISWVAYIKFKDGHGSGYSRDGDEEDCNHNFNPFIKASKNEQSISSRTD
jgi:hypothetical protein